METVANDIPQRDTADASPPRETKAPWGLIVVAIVLAGAALMLHLTPIRAWISDARRVRGAVSAVGIWVYPLSIAATALLLACGVPRLPIHAAGGVIFGFWLGLALTLAGATVGHYAVFCLIRWSDGQWARRRWPKLRAWHDLAQDHGTPAVLLARQLPAHAMMINAALAFSGVSHRDFLIGTAVGLLTEAVPATLIGAGLVKPSLTHSIGYVALAAAGLAMIWVFAARIVRCGAALHSPMANDP